MGLLRFLFYILVGYFAYVFLRSLFRKVDRRRNGEHLDGGQTAGRRLEQDPVCGIYITRETAVKRGVNGREMFFCSEHCAGKYLTGSAGRS